MDSEAPDYADGVILQLRRSKIPRVVAVGLLR
jgi:hypothetical protein